MSISEPSEIIQLLRGIEQRSRAHAAGLPQQEEVQQYWEGVVFSLNGAYLAAPLNEVAEILHFPAVVTHVPGTQPWMQGVANIRGNLLPIVDLQLFLGGEQIIDDRRSRVLIIRRKEVFIGLLVQEVVGMRHIPQHQQIDFPPPNGLMGRFVKSAFEHDGETWPVFGMFALVESKEFQIAAL